MDNDSDEEYDNNDSGSPTRAMNTSNIIILLVFLARRAAPSFTLLAPRSILCAGTKISEFRDIPE